VSRGRIGRTSRGAARAGRKIRASAPKSNRHSCEERFELFLQPIHPLRLAESAARYEVLLRLRMPDDSLIEPAAFLGAAAQLELMPAIDRWVVRTLLVWLLNHRAYWMRTPTVFAVNVSVQALTDPHFVSYVGSCLEKSEIPPQALCFEVAERSAASGNAGVWEAMYRLEALGCEVALDQFGVSAPGLRYLRDVPADYFKIDGSLVSAAPRDRVANAMISGDRQDGELARRANRRRFGRTRHGTRCAAHARRRLCAGLFVGPPAGAHAPRVARKFPHC
jgi:EAL domain-containing protein (putative c-di-GMP-specific phosphodiesterase class I)